METCPDCGNSDVRAAGAPGAFVRECGLCGALFGDPAAVQTLEDEREARREGVDPAVWPLVRALRRLAGMTVVASHGGDAEARTLPFVHLAVTDAAGLVEGENLAKSLLLASRGHHLHWVLEVEYRHRLVLALKPRAGDGVAAERVRQARLDLAALGREIPRDAALSWWRHPGGTREPRGD